ncbi:MAG: LysM domain-containing protein [Comamonadaceae bacterium]|nr:MAG: LysM domain-containing protein [Comamonadaceae bacterium]
MNTFMSRVPHGFRGLLLSCGLLACACAAQAADPLFTYTVQTGDELIKMAEASFTSNEGWKEVSTLNRLKDPNKIQPGQVLKIPLRLLKMVHREGILLSVSGEVLLSGQPATVGSLVPEGAQLHTGAHGSAQIQLADQSRVTLMPNTDAKLVTSQIIDFGNFDQKSQATWYTGLIRLTQGAVDVMAAKLARRNTPLQVETPTSVAGVRGTVFRVAYDDPASQNTRTEVLEGLVRTDSVAQKTGADLPKGTGTVLNPTVQQIKVSPLLEAPKLSGKAVVFKPLARWDMPALAGAERFKVQVSGFKDFSTIVREQVVAKQGRADFSGLPNGLWHVRVRGIDARTLEGFNANTTLQVMLPANASHPEVEWVASLDRMEVINGEHVLQFEPLGLEASHVVLASVKINRPPFVRVSKALVKPDGGPIRLNLGPLSAGENYLINLTVTQADGATLSPTNYAFDGLAAGQSVQSPLKRLADDTVPAPVEPAHKSKRSKRDKVSSS